MNSKWISSFLTVADCGSVNKAAKMLYISQQALNQQINLLEAEVGVALFDRKPIGVSLTLAGNEFLKYAQQMESLYATALSRCRLASKAEKKIRIPITNNVTTPKLMERTCAEFNLTSDFIKTEFISVESFGSWFDGLKNLQFDLVEHFAVDGRVPKGIHFEYLSDVQSWCIMSVDHPLAGKNTLCVEDLDGHKLKIQLKAENMFIYIQMYIDGAGLDVEISSVDSNRYDILHALNDGFIYMGDATIPEAFPGFRSIPLDFNMHLQHGFACREEMRETYQHFFDIAHKLIENEKA